MVVLGYVNTSCTLAFEKGGGEALHGPLQLSFIAHQPPTLCFTSKQEGGQSPEPLAIQPYNGGAQPRSGTAARGGRTAWRWVQAPGAERIVVPATYRGAPLVLQQGINPNQALLLNSLRRLLQVSPQLEQELKRWCAEPLGDSMLAADRQGAGAADHRRLHREAPDLGAQFAQLVKELRSEYFAAITLCAERLAAELAKSPATSVVQLLRRDGVFASTQQLSAAVSGADGHECVHGQHCCRSGRA